MSSELKYFIFHTGPGWIGIVSSAKGLLSTTLPQPSAQEAHLQLGTEVNQAVQAPSLFADLAERFSVYFRGQKTTFPDKLDLSGATSFQRRVWQQTRLIPYGETRSYLWIAQQINQPAAARAVGQALGRNPLPIIIPCHRVVTSDGSLGGFSGGLEMKRYLLGLETAKPQLKSSAPGKLRSR